MTTVFTSAKQGKTDSPGTHVFIAGVGDYPCLLGGSGHLVDKPMGLGQLSSPPLSAVALADWFVGRLAPDPEVDERVGFYNPNAPLASVEMLVSPGLSYQCPDGTTVAVDAATRDNIDACYGAWLDRAKSHPRNISVFYFCGHGVAGSSDYILPSDFGAHKKNPWSDAIDITETARAARREVSGSLYFFIDACRQTSRDSLMPGAMPPALQYVDFDRRVLCFTRMLLWATGEGASAFGAKGQVSRFSKSLINALSGFYGEEAGTDGWAVTGEALAKSVRTLLDAGNASLDDSMHQHVEQQLIGSQVLHYETRQPKAVGRVVSTWSANSIVRDIARTGGEALGEGAQEALAEQLEQRNLQVDELRREIEEWTRRYRELEQRLADEPDSALAQQARSYLAEGKFEEAGALLDELIKAAESRLAAERERLTSNYLSRAQVYALQFRPLEALPYFRKAYDLLPEEPNYALPYALALQQQNDHQRAESVYTSVLSVLKNRAEANPALYQLKVATTLNNLGMLYRNTERLSDAESACREALGICHELAKSDSTAFEYVATTLNNLANLYSDTERFVQAESAYQEALRIYRTLAEASPAAYRPDVAMTLNNLGNRCRETGRLTEAETVYLEALGIRRELAEADPAGYRPDVATTLNNLGNLYGDTGRLAEAETAYDEALGIYRMLAEANPAAYRPDVAMTLNNLGLFYRDTGRVTEAETAYDEALGIRRKLAEANPSAQQRYLATTLNNLGNLYRATDRLTGAENAYEEALRIRQTLAKANPSAHRPGVATILNNLGLLYRDTGRLSKAETAYQEALDIRRELAEANPAAHQPNVAWTLNDFGSLYRDTGRLTEAETAYREALDIYRTLAEADPAAYRSNVAWTLNDLGSFYRDNGRLTEAEAAYREAFDIYRTLPPTGPM